MDKSSCWVMGAGKVTGGITFHRKAREIALECMRKAIHSTSKYYMFYNAYEHEKAIRRLEKGRNHDKTRTG